MASITKRGDYQWQAIIRRKGWDSQTNTFETRADAEKWARSIESEMDVGAFVPNREEQVTTLRAALERYLKEKTPTKRGGDIEAVRLSRLLKKLPFLGKPLVAVSSGDLNAYIEHRRKEGVKDATIRLDIALISNLYTVAKLDWGMETLRNPCQRVRKPRGSDSRSRRLSNIEEVGLIDAAASVARNSDGTYASGTRVWYLKPLLLFALETAMRRGELAVIQWEDVNFERRFVKLYLTKNGDPRNVPLSPRGLEILREMEPKPNGLVFECTANAITCAWKQLVKRARQNYQRELGENADKRMFVDLRFHDLRHEATTRLSSKLSNVLELSAVTGHKSLQVLKRYYNPTPEELAEKLA
jgi:integrase